MKLMISRDSDIKNIMSYDVINISKEELLNMRDETARDLIILFRAEQDSFYSPDSKSKKEFDSIGFRLNWCSKIILVEKNKSETIIYDYKNKNYNTYLIEI